MKVQGRHLLSHFKERGTEAQSSDLPQVPHESEVELVGIVIS